MALLVLSAYWLPNSLLKELPKFTPDLTDPSLNIFLNYKNFLAGTGSSTPSAG